MSLQHVSISSGLTTASLGRAWLDLVDHIVREGTPMGDEGLELLGPTVVFRAGAEPDELLTRFADRQMIAEMRKVFFSDSPNALGHSYAKVICGPDGRHDLEDIIALLKREPATKRALVTFSSRPGGKVPCVTAVQLLIRNQELRLMYFARGQDAFKKFYADALCLVAMGEKVSQTLGVALGIVHGFIGSSHVYHQDMPLIKQTLAAALQSNPAKTGQGVLT